MRWASSIFMPDCLPRLGASPARKLSVFQQQFPAFDQARDGHYCRRSMGQATVVGGLLGSLALGVLIGCAGSGDPQMLASDAGNGPADAVAPVDVSDGPMYPRMCFNNDKDPGETDFDCGGNCKPCMLGQGCAIMADCMKGQCVSNKCTAPATCSNGKRDVNETDVDCGGPDCATCATGKKCKIDSDCASGMCASGACA